MFRKAADFEAFERVMIEAHHREPIRILAYCILSNHWHFVVCVGNNRRGYHFGSYGGTTRDNGMAHSR